MFTFLFGKQSGFHSQKTTDKSMPDFLSTHGSQNLVFVINLQQIAVVLPVTTAQREDRSTVQDVSSGAGKPSD